MKRLSLVGIWLVCLFSAAYSLCRMLYAIATNEDRAWTIALAFDELGNAATNGEAGETISSRANRARGEGRAWGCILCRFLDTLKKNHCALSSMDKMPTGK